MGLTDNLMNFIERYMYWFSPTSVSRTDIVEIIIITFMIYEIMAWIKRTRAWILFKGIVFILLFVLIAAIFQMNTILWIAGKAFNVGMVAIIVVFQPELRNALEHLGRKKILASLFLFDTQDKLFVKQTNEMVEEVSRAAVEMGKAKTGALIVFEKNVPLNEYIRTGIDVDSLVTRQLILNIFEHNTPLHDGAVIVRENRIAAATCYLPLSDDLEISKDLGTRHRAAIGMSEVSDSLTVVVSEETGKISVAKDGMLRRDLNGEELSDTLNRFLCGEQSNISRMDRLRRRLKNVKKANK